MSYPTEVNESLNVYDDGSVWYWSLKPALVDLHNRVGTFSFQLPGREFADLRKLAAKLAATEAAAQSPAQGTIAYSVIAYGDGKTQTHLLSVSATDEPGARFATDELERAYKIGEDLARRAEDAPLAVVRLDWKPGEAGVKVGQVGNVIFTFRNIGIKPVSLLVGYDEYALYEVEKNGTSSQIWRGADLMGTGIKSEGPDMGGPPMNGIYAEATVEPGTTSSAFFRDALIYQEPTTAEIGGAVIGKMNIYYPQGSTVQTAAEPQWPFSLETKPKTVVAR